MKNRLLSEQVLKLQRTVIDQQTTRKVIEKVLAQAKESVAISDQLTAKLSRSDKLVEAARAHVASVKEQLARTGTEKATLDKVIV